MLHNFTYKMQSVNFPDYSNCINFLSNVLIILLHVLYLCSLVLFVCIVNIFELHVVEFKI